LELTTVYCVGVLKNRLAMLHEDSQPPKSATDALRRDLERLGEFIGPRLGDLDSTRLAIARRRANDDFMSWHADVDACMHMCANERDRPSREKRRACWYGCSHTGTSWERMRICNVIDWLPP
ncbi:hypothetical protein QTH97_33415, partial [Variovorax sp. J22R24]|uniref:hypothetical protein n=1 Tax=Variovorax gracilis TaxID=3053502 RepID=UPI002576CE84